MANKDLLDKMKSINKKDFKITPPKMPTDEEMKERTLSRWKMVEPVLLSNLGPDILKLSMPTVFFKIPTKEISDEWLIAWDGKEMEGPAKRLTECLTWAINHFDGEVFFKLDGRSPKDWGIVKFTKDNIDEIVTNFFASERMLDDVIVQRHHRKHFMLCFRKWVELKNEFRIFVKDRKVQGITWYDYTSDELPVNHKKLQKRVTTLAQDYLEKINPNVEINDYVFDIGFVNDEPILIELNPYGLSDPCCFKTYDNIKGFAWKRKNKGD
jgi:hypothetical protein